MRIQIITLLTQTQMSPVQWHVQTAVYLMQYLSITQTFLQCVDTQNVLDTYILCLCLWRIHVDLIR